MSVPRIRLSQEEHDEIISKRKLNAGNTLIIGDLHAPFIHKDYLNFCIDMQKKWSCKNIVFIGDLIDNHYSSFHETDPDGMGAGMELQKAKEQIQGFYKAFPNAVVTKGNHDSIPSRVGFKNGLSDFWLRSISEVLETPNWEYKEVHMQNGIMFCHGLGQQATARMENELCSVVQGHYHSKSYIKFISGTPNLFALQIGCGIDINTYAMAYAKWYKKIHLNVGIILDNKIPILEYME